MIRPAQSDDIPALVRMMGEFYAESHYSLDPAWATRSFSDLLGSELRGAAWMAFLDAQAAGYVVMTLRHSMELGGLDGFVDDLFVRPGCRRRGLGKSLLAAVFDGCAARNVLAIHVETSAGNEAAQAIYRKFGFRGNELQLLTAPVRGSAHAP
jgi:ribosomal protein S18 acetylase RimI-like enzyme